MDVSAKAWFGLYLGTAESHPDWAAPFWSLSGDDDGEPVTVGVFDGLECRLEWLPNGTGEAGYALAASESVVRSYDGEVRELPEEWFGPGTLATLTLWMLSLSTVCDRLGLVDPPAPWFHVHGGVS